MAEIKDIKNQNLKDMARQKLADQIQKKAADNLDNINKSQEINVDNNAILLKIADSLKISAGVEEQIKKYLKNESDKNLKDILKDETNTTNEDNKNEQDYEKIVNPLRKIFQENFAPLKNSFTPGGLLKGFGLLNNSPIFALMGDKLDNLINSAKSSYNEYKEQKEKQAEQYKEQHKLDFLNEELENEKLRLAKEQNKLLEDIKDKEFTIKDEKKGLLATILAPLTAMFSKGLLKPLSKVFGPITKLFGGGLKGAGILGKLGKFGKFGGKLLGKAALPLQLLLSGVDFAKGFGNAEEISGRKGDNKFLTKFTAGTSNVLSGLTFGLLDPKDIFKFQEAAREKFINFISAPFKAIKDIFSGKSLSDVLANMWSTMSLNLFSPDEIKNAGTYIWDKLKSFITNPFQTIKDIYNDMNLVDFIGDKLDQITNGAINGDIVKEKLNAVKDGISNAFNMIFDDIKSFFAESDLIKNLTSLPDKLAEPFNNIKEAIKTKLESIIDLLKFDPIEAVKNKTKGFFDFFNFSSKPKNTNIDELNKSNIISNNNIVNNNEVKTISKIEEKREVIKQKEIIKTEQKNKEQTKIIERILESNKQNNFVNNTQNNVIQNEDLSTSNTDKEWVNSLRY